MGALRSRHTPGATRAGGLGRGPIGWRCTVRGGRLLAGHGAPEALAAAAGLLASVASGTAPTTPVCTLTAICLSWGAAWCRWASLVGVALERWGRPVRIVADHHQERELRDALDAADCPPVQPLAELVAVELAKIARCQADEKRARAAQIAGAGNHVPIPRVESRGGGAVLLAPGPARHHPDGGRCWPRLGAEGRPRPPLRQGRSRVGAVHAEQSEKPHRTAPRPW